MTSEELQKLLSDKNLSKELVQRHLIPGTLYTTGMRYYQIKDSIVPDKPITISKQSGKS